MTIGLDELVARLEVAAGKMGKKNENRLLLLNAAQALKALGAELERAWMQQAKDQRTGEQQATDRSLIVLPGGMHHVQ